MTTAEFKRVGRLLKEVYAELEQEALSDGVDIFSEEYLKVRDILRERVLAKLGFTIEEYREAKELVAPAKKVDVAERISELSGKAGELESKLEELVIPDEGELLQKAKQLAEEVVKPPVIQNNIVERTTVEKPTIVHTTVKETVNEEYDPSPLYAEIGYLNDRLDNIKIPEIPDLDSKIETVKDEMKSEFMAELQHNINTLGMPDFRKLAMGLQAQIDEVRNQPTSSASRTAVVTSGDTSAGVGGDFIYYVPGNHTITLPDAVGNTGLYVIKNNYTSHIFILSLGGLIDGESSIELPPENSVTLISDDTNWSIV